MACTAIYQKELAARAGSHLECRRAGITKLKGKDAEVEVYAVYPGSEVGASMEDTPGSSVTMCDRQDDLAAVSAALAAGSRAGAGLVLLEGPSGCGRSELLRAVAAKVGAPQPPDHSPWPWQASVLELRLNGANEPPFHICHCLMEWLLRDQSATLSGGIKLEVRAIPMCHRMNTMRKGYHLFAVY